MVLIGRAACIYSSPISTFKSISPHTSCPIHMRFSELNPLHTRLEDGNCSVFRNVGYAQRFMWLTPESQSFKSKSVVAKLIALWI